MGLRQWDAWKWVILRDQNGWAETKPSRLETIQIQFSPWRLQDDRQKTYALIQISVLARENLFCRRSIKAYNIHDFMFIENVI